MKQTKLHACWEDNKKGLNAWCSIPSSVTAEILSGFDFESITIDLQHGLIDYQVALTMLQAISSTNITPLARVPWNEPGIIMKLLDAGALGIICPMINNAEDAKNFVQATKYVPDGYRSSGPTRAMLVHGNNYHNEANKHIISLAMVETLEALENVEKIAATKGLTGIYIGPSDLSVSLGLNPGLDRKEPEVVKAISRILNACKDNNIVAGIHCLSPDYIKKAYDDGFSFATLGTDIRFFSQIFSAQLSQVGR